MNLSPSSDPTPFGRALRRWRTTRRLSQLTLAGLAETPSRHVSFLETGRARPSRAMVLRMGEALELPLDERNALLATAGFAPVYPTSALADEALQPVRFVIDRLLTAHSPYPGVVLDRWYDILDANLGARRLFLGGAEVDPHDPPNLYDLMLGPLRPLIINWEEVVADALRRLRRQVFRAPDDARLADLLTRLESIAAGLDLAPEGAAAPVLLTRVRFAGTELATLSTLVHFGGAQDLTVEGLHLELIYPADAATDQVLKALGAPA